MVRHQRSQVIALQSQGSTSPSGAVRGSSEERGPSSEQGAPGGSLCVPPRFLTGLGEGHGVCFPWGVFRGRLDWPEASTCQQSHDTVPAPPLRVFALRVTQSLCSGRKS